MADSVALSLPVTEIVESESAPTRTYKLDLEKGRIVGMVDDLEAVKQAIVKAIITPRFHCLIYDDQYGSEIEEAYIDGDVSSEYIETTAEWYVKDALLPDDRILDTYNFNFVFSGDEAYISFDADTIYGEVHIEEVI